jgi:hypothetical protein
VSPPTTSVVSAFARLASPEKPSAQCRRMADPQRSDHLGNPQTAVDPHADRKFTMQAIRVRRCATYSRSVRSCEPLAFRPPDIAKGRIGCAHRPALERVGPCPQGAKPTADRAIAVGPARRRVHKLQSDGTAMADPSIIGHPSFSFESTSHVIANMVWLVA